MAGNLNRHSSWWQSNCSSTWVLKWVRFGFPLWWQRRDETPPPFRSPNQPGAIKHAIFVSETVAAALKAGAIMRWHKQPTVVNPLNVTPKKNGKLRLILNLRHVNKYLAIPKFKMENLQLAETLALPGDWMFAIDLAQA